MDWFKQASELTDEWMKTQKKMFETYSSNFTTGSAKETYDTNSFTDNPMMNFFVEASQKLAQQYAQAMSPVKAKTAQDYFDDSQKAMNSTFAEMWASNEEFWSKLASHSSMGPEQSSDNDQYFEIFKKSMNPDAWVSSAFANLDFMNRKFSDSPPFAGTTNFDKKLQVIGDNWNVLQQALVEYSGVVMEVWMTAYENFRKDTEEKLAAESWPTSWKEVTDSWMEIANKALLEMQKSESYLKAQKDVINANSEYRMAEQTVAEELCELYHIPTRTEVDELHHKVYLMNKELRELRKLKKQASNPKVNTAKKKKDKADVNDVGN